MNSKDSNILTYDNISSKKNSFVDKYQSDCSVKRFTSDDIELINNNLNSIEPKYDNQNLKNPKINRSYVNFTENDRIDSKMSNLSDLSIIENIKHIKSDIKEPEFSPLKCNQNLSLIQSIIDEESSFNGSIVDINKDDICDR